MIPILVLVCIALAGCASTIKKEDSNSPPVVQQQPTPPPQPSPGIYVVKPGDTGAKIANLQKVGLADLLAANPGVNWARLTVGQQIRVPQVK
ncbi:MAG TPA: LysM domain-containing protein [Opitutaceae bacterium]|nr:LysM domain-containing protein [Opitutaceae bacterium]